MQVEEDELGVFRVPPRHEELARASQQQRYAARIAQPLRPPSATHTDFLRCPRTLRGKGSRSLDTLFTSNSDGTFWFYGTQKISQATLGPLSNRSAPTTDEVRRSAIGATIRRQLDAMVAQGASKERFGIIFDLVSTSKIIASGSPHEIGAYIYAHVEETHYDKTGLKFVFVGITDNVNCCAARDVFCRVDVVAGHYVGDTKRPFEALDNVHMYTVFPGHRLHPFRSTPDLEGNRSGAVRSVGGVLDVSNITRPGTKSGARPESRQQQPSRAASPLEKRPMSRGGGGEGGSKSTSSPLPELRPGTVAELDAPSAFITQATPTTT